MADQTVNAIARQAAEKVWNEPSIGAPEIIDQMADAVALAVLNYKRERMGNRADRCKTEAFWALEVELREMDAEIKALSQPVSPTAQEPGEAGPAVTPKVRHCGCGVKDCPSCGLDDALAELAVPLAPTPPETKTLAEQEIDAAWFMIEHGWDIETRAELEKAAKTNGFKFGLAQAIHHLGKRCVIENAWMKESSPSPGAVETPTEEESAEAYERLLRLHDARGREIAALRNELQTAREIGEKWTGPVEGTLSSVVLRLGQSRESLALELADLREAFALRSGGSR